MDKKDKRYFFTWPVYDLVIGRNGIARYEALPPDDPRRENLYRRIHVVETNRFMLLGDPRREWERAARIASEHFDSVYVVVSEKKPRPSHREGKVNYEIRVYRCDGLCKQHVVKAFKDYLELPELGRPVRRSHVLTHGLADL